MVRRMLLDFDGVVHFELRIRGGGGRLYGCVSAGCWKRYTRVRGVVLGSFEYEVMAWISRVLGTGIGKAAKGEVRRVGCVVRVCVDRSWADWPIILQAGLVGSLEYSKRAYSIKSSM